MSNRHTEFWLAFLDHARDMDNGTRLWNGYLVVTFQNCVDDTGLIWHYVTADLLVTGLIRRRRVIYASGVRGFRL